VGMGSMAMADGVVDVPLGGDEVVACGETSGGAAAADMGMLVGAAVRVDGTCGVADCRSVGVGVGVARCGPSTRILSVAASFEVFRSPRHVAVESGAGLIRWENSKVVPSGVAGETVTLNTVWMFVPSGCSAQSTRCTLCELPCHARGAPKPGIADVSTPAERPTVNVSIPGR
jgi:hypothetical protein